MAFNPLNQGGPAPMNPYTGSPTAQRGSASTGGGMPRTAAGGMPVKRRAQAQPQGIKGTKRRSRTRRGGRPLGDKADKFPKEAPMPQTPMPSESSPLGVDWSVSRGLGNGGY